MHATVPGGGLRARRTTSGAPTPLPWTVAAGAYRSAGRGDADGHCAETLRAVLALDDHPLPDQVDTAVLPSEPEVRCAEGDARGRGLTQLDALFDGDVIGVPVVVGGLVVAGGRRCESAKRKT